METIQKYLQDDLFIEINLHYKKDTYYAWGDQERIEKHFSYIIKDIVNTTSVLVQKSNNHRVHYIDILKNDNKYETYDDALKAASEECDEILKNVPKINNHG